MNIDKGVSLTQPVERNPIIRFNDEVDVLFIGDPHLGKRFITGVPSHRLGERERYVFKDFETLLNTKDVQHIVIVGDIFDKFVVSPTIVDTTYELISFAATSNKNVQYHIIPGNHDLSKDLTKSSSYKLLFNLLLNLSPNVHIHLDVCRSVRISNSVVFHFDCYSPFKDWDEIKFDTDTKDLNVLIGHFDDLEVNKTAYLPSKDVLDSMDVVITGHIHTYKNHKYSYSDTPVIYTGSLQPYSHAEDPDKSYYVTVNWKDLDESKLDQYKYKCVRILVEKDDVVSNFSLDCFSLSFKKVEDEVEPTVDDINILLDQSSYRDRLMVWLQGTDEISEENKEELLNTLRERKYESD